MAFYGARRQEGKVFLKQYKSPSPAVIWYDIRDTNRSSRQSRTEGCAYAVDWWRRSRSVGWPSYFAASEFVENAATSNKSGWRARNTRAPSAPTGPACGCGKSPGQRCSGGIAAIPSEDVHADLKPRTII